MKEFNLRESLLNEFKQLCKVSMCMSVDLKQSIVAVQALIYRALPFIKCIFLCKHQGTLPETFKEASAMEFYYKILLSVI